MASQGAVDEVKHAVAGTVANPLQGRHIEFPGAVEQRQDKRPQLSDLRDSGSIEQDADVVIFIYRDEYYNPDTSERPNIAEVNVAKHRNGPTAVVDLYWHGQLATFRNLQRQEIAL